MVFTEREIKKLEQIGKPKTCRLDRMCICPSCGNHVFSRNLQERSVQRVYVEKKHQRVMEYCKCWEEK